MPEIRDVVRHGHAIAAAARWSPSPARQFGRFVLVGAVSSALYAVLFLVLAGIDAQLANLIAGTASMVLANHLHRLVTFRAGARVTWLTAQIRGGGLSVVALLATSLSLAAANRLVGDTTALQQLLLVGGVSGVIGTVRFVALHLLVFRLDPASACPASWTASPTGAARRQGRHAPGRRPGPGSHRRIPRRGRSGRRAHAARPCLEPRTTSSARVAPVPRGLPAEGPGAGRVHHDGRRDDDPALPPRAGSRPRLSRPSSAPARPLGPHAAARRRRPGTSWSSAQAGTQHQLGCSTDR